MNRLAPSLSLVRLWCDIQVARHSAWLPIALLWFAVAAGAWSMLVPLGDQIDAMREALVHQAARSAPAEAPAAAVPPEADLVASLPDASASSVALETLIDLAKEHQLGITQADYQNGLNRHDVLQSLQVTLPLEGDYPSVRRWIEDVLRKLPNASIDRIAFERASVGTSRIVARVKLTLWFRGGMDTK